MTGEDTTRRRARQLAAEAVAAGDRSGWFETLYAEAQRGVSVVPWDDRQPNPLLAQWATDAVARGVISPGCRTLVVGCGVCDDPEFLAGLGCRVTAFDVSPTAVDVSRRRFADSPVSYRV